MFVFSSLFRGARTVPLAANYAHPRSISKCIDVKVVPHFMNVMLADLYVLSLIANEAMCIVRRLHVAPPSVNLRVCRHPLV